METEKQLAKQDLSQEDIKILTEVGVIPKDCSAELVKLYSRICAETQLNPFRKQIHFIRRGNSYTIQVGIDGYRSIADRTGLYAGSDDYVFDYLNGDGSINKEPVKATSIVYKLVGGVRCAFSASARMSEYKPNDVKMQFMWNKMSHLMLGKCAESLALRKAFPNELSGTYTDEEMQQADVIDISPKKSQVEEFKKSINEIAKKAIDIVAPQETNGENKISPTSNGEALCVNCGVVIKSKGVTENSMKEFNKVLCWKNQNDCQEVVRNAQKADAEFSVPEFESEEEI